MSLVVNNNLMAANVARNLNAHYGRLNTSTQRLSSGLRINSAADDAAGLAIRELQRADIAALQQGARNANDAISMIQVADGSLGIIDEKLIRMKELAEQAATGTYDSTQRLMIESEYQAMASEITRIANATDFNGTKLLDGTLAGDHDGSDMISEGKMKIHFGTGNDSAEDYYYIEIGECTSEAFGLGNNSTWQDVQRRGVEAFKDSLLKQIREDKTITDEERGNLLAAVDDAGEQLEEALKGATDYRTAYRLWATDGATGFLEEGKKAALEKFGNSDLMERYLAAANKALEEAPIGATDANKVATNIATRFTDGFPAFTDLPADVQAAPTADNLKPLYEQQIANAMAAAKAEGLNDEELASLQAVLNNITAPTSKATWDALTRSTGNATATTSIVKAITDTIVPGNTNVGGVDAVPVALRNQGKLEAQTALDDNIETFWNELRETQKQKLQYAWGQAAIYNLASKEADAGREPGDYGIGAKFDFANILASDTDDKMLDQALKDMQAKVGHMDFAGYTVETQEDAQMALNAINEAIVSKDKIRAHLGAAQNRLENTVSNLNIQAENLQAAESRISDVDVATEMTQFVRNQILTQSAVAMLSQANSLPQMAMQLIGG